MLFISRIGVIRLLGKRYSSLYSIENVLNEDNMKKTSAKFANMKPIRLKTFEPYKKAAVLIPLCVINNKVSLLYTLRAPHLKSHRGQVSFPGGMFDDKDHTLEHTALRETEEELGIREEKIIIWGSGKFIVTRNDLSVLPVIGQIKGKLDLNSLKINQHEVDQVFVVPLEDLCHSKNLGYTQFREGYSLPTFLGGQIRIWGLTAMITHIFLRALLPSTAYAHKVKHIAPVTNSSMRYFNL